MIPDRVSLAFVLCARQGSRMNANAFQALHHSLCPFWNPPSEREAFIHAIVLMRFPKLCLYKRFVAESHPVRLMNGRAHADRETAWR
jgi:hypothetical protein